MSCRIHRVLNIMGIQDHVMQDECAMVHDRSMTATENLKAAKAPKAVAVKSDGTLSKLNLAKLNTALSAFADSGREMEASLLTATTSSDVISPALVQRLSAVKCGMDAESAALELYKENNREEDTVNVVKAAMDKLNQARNQFKIMKKMLKAMQPSPLQAESQCN